MICRLPLPRSGCLHFANLHNPATAVVWQISSAVRNIFPVLHGAVQNDVETIRPTVQFLVFIIVSHILQTGTQSRSFVASSCIVSRYQPGSTKPSCRMKTPNPRAAYMLVVSMGIIVIEYYYLFTSIVFATVVDRWWRIKQTCFR